MILPGTYANGFAPRDGQPLYPQIWHMRPYLALMPGLGPTGNSFLGWDGARQRTSHVNTVTQTPVGGRYAATFSGSRSSTDNTLRHGIGTGNFTWCVWVKPTTISSAYRCVITNGSFAPGLYVTSTVSSQLLLYAGANISSGTVLTAGVWQHIAVRRTGTTVEFFVNGIKTSGSGTSSFSIADSAMSVGSSAAGSQSESYDGSVDDVFCFASALPDSLIRIMASRRGVAAELAPRHRSSVVAAASFNRRRRLLVGAGS